jgi:hypothetical protein
MLSSQYHYSSIHKISIQLPIQSSMIVYVSHKQGIMCNTTSKLYLGGFTLKFQLIFLVVITKILLYGIFKFLPVFMVIVYVSFPTETQSTHFRIQRNS